VEHVVDEDDGFAGDIEGDDGGPGFLGNGFVADVVAVKGGVDLAGGQTGVEGRGDPPVELQADIGDSDEAELAAVGVTGIDGGCQVVDGSVDRGGVESQRRRHRCRF
jgi:hypothetical protein